MYIRQMTAADIACGLRLCAQSGWNQLEADWRRQLDLEPDGCFVAINGGRPVGTACCCVFGDVAWINMVLVEQTKRGCGFGTALMRHVVGYLDDRGVASIRLDATPLGQPIYEKLGFTPEFTLARFGGEFPSRFDVVPGVEPVPPDEMPNVWALDQEVTGTNRETLLRYLHEKEPEWTRHYVKEGRFEGFSFCRPGRKAWQVGPIIGSRSAGLRLLLDLARRFASSPVYMDVPTDHQVAVDLATAMGLSEQRRLLRMGRGKRVQEDLSRLWCSFGPEKG